jgi:hypothetical protein
MGRGVGGDEVAVDDEHEVELRVLREACDLDVLVEVDARVTGDLRVQPLEVLARATRGCGGDAQFELPCHLMFLPVRFALERL